MEKINIARLRELLSCRIANPQEYKGRTLILWNCDYTRDGILYGLIKESCIAYNMTQPKENGAWFKCADYCFTTDDNTAPEVLCDCKQGDMCAFMHKGILFFTGCCSRENNEKLITFINTHANDKGMLSENWALVACVHAECGFVPDMFSSNCEIYELVPEVEEWGEFMMARYNETVCKPVVEYIKGNGFRMRILSWTRVIAELEDTMEELNLEDLAQMSKKDFNHAVKFSGAALNEWSVVKETIDDFYEFLHR